MARKCNIAVHAYVLEITSRVCKDCVKTGDRWIHLRFCLACGHVGCCDSLGNTHADWHLRKTGHPLVRSIEPGENRVWRYIAQMEPGEIVKGQFRPF